MWGGCAGCGNRAVAEWLRALKRNWRVARAMREIAARRVDPRPHGLGLPLIVSLTSYPPRFPTLAITLRALLGQSVGPDRVILWIAAPDMAALPDDVRALRGLEIRPCDNLRSYKKFAPAMAEFPEAVIVTADDDMYYGPDWLADLVGVAQAYPGRIVAHRAHRVRWQGDALAPYGRWDKNITGAVEGSDIFATGVGGVLYPPGSLASEAVRADLFMDLCPSADDVWLYWMARRAGTVVRHVGPPMRIVEWPGSQEQSLRAQNHGAEAGNDRAIAAMTAHFGGPG